MFAQITSGRVALQRKQNALVHKKDPQLRLGAIDMSPRFEGHGTFYKEMSSSSTQEAQRREQVRKKLEWSGGDGDKVTRKKQRARKLGRRASMISGLDRKSIVAARAGQSRIFPRRLPRVRLRSRLWRSLATVALRFFYRFLRGTDAHVRLAPPFSQARAHMMVRGRTARKCTARTDGGDATTVS